MSSSMKFLVRGAGQLVSGVLRVSYGGCGATQPALVGRVLAVSARSYSGASSAFGDFTFRQLFDYDTWTYSFLLADNASREAVIIDPVYEQADRDVNLVKELGLNLIYGINTHMHADHVTGTAMLKRQIPTCKSVIAKYTKAKADRYVVDGEIIKFGKFQLECRNTPGHTDGCMTYVLHEKAMAFTGDALLIRKCGRTDFPNGNTLKLKKAIHEKILSLPDHYLLYPGHDYAGHTVTTVAEEKKWNIRVFKEDTELVKEMEDIAKRLGLPNKFVVSIASNLVDGEELRYELPKDL